MVTKSKEGSLNEAIHDKLSSLPDPLHFELPHGHRKLMEVAYAVIVAVTILVILIMGNMRILSIEQANVSAMMILMLSILLGIFLIEKSTISHKPSKSRS
jgi:Na+/alanine symporter